MKISITLECDCGNVQTYKAEEKHHEGIGETYTDLTEEIYDDKFQAKAISDGMWVSCRGCLKGHEVI